MKLALTDCGWGDWKASAKGLDNWSKSFDVCEAGDGTGSAANKSISEADCEDDVLLEELLKNGLLLAVGELTLDWKFKIMQDGLRYLYLNCFLQTEFFL